MSECTFRILRHMQEDPEPGREFSVGGYKPKSKSKKKHVTHKVERIVSPGVTVTASHGLKEDPVIVRISGPLAQTVTIRPGEFGSIFVCKAPPISVDFDHAPVSPVRHPRRRI